MQTIPSRGSDGSGERLPVYILAGGRSRRFGSDKARALVDGVPMIVRLVETFTSFAESVTVVAARAGSYEDLGLKTIGDVVEKRGPIGGLATALDDYRGDDWIFVSACDWIGARSEWIAALLASRKDAGEAVVFRSERLEPLFGLYHSAIRDTVSCQLESGRLAMHELLGAISTIVVPAPLGWSGVVNMNRPGPA